MKIVTLRQVALWLVAVSLMAVVGCVSSGPESRFYQLSLSTSTNQLFSTESSPVIVMGPIVVAPYLSKPLVVTRLGANELRYEETHRWSEPLRTGIPVFVYDLAQRQMPDVHIVPFPFDSVTDADLQVTVGLLRLDGDEKGNVQLHARWRIRDPQRKITLRSEVTQLQAKGKSGNVDESIRLHSELLEQLTLTILGELQTVLKELPTPTK